MAKNIDFMGAIFPDVPSVKLPQQGGGLVAFDDTTDATATADKILQGYTAYANGEKLVGTASGGITPSGTISITQNGQVDVTNYATADVNVSGGGGTSGDANDPIRFFDYDGTVVASYKNVPTALPSIPVHSGLTDGAWNYTLSQIAEQFQSCGTCDIGVMYSTESGDTEIDINLVDESLRVSVATYLNGRGYIDWGDGSEATALVGTNIDVQNSNIHNYQSSGQYTIKIHISSGTLSLRRCINGTTERGGFVLKDPSNTSSENRGICGAVTAVRIGQNVQLGIRAFFFFRNMRYVTIPSNIDSFGEACFNSSGINYVTVPDGVSVIENSFQSCATLRNISMPIGITALHANAFSGCTALCRVSIPKNVTQMASSVLNSCQSLTKIIVPPMCTSLDNYAFGNCAALSYLEIPESVTQFGASASVVPSTSSLFVIRFKGTTPPTAPANGLSGLPTSGIIYVPESAVDAYKTATGFSSVSGKIRGE